MSRVTKVYDKEYKIQAVKLAEEIGGAKAAWELDIPKGTLYCWMKQARDGELITGSSNPSASMTLAEEVNMLRKQVKDLTKENRRLKDENEFLEEASAFFAASRRKSQRTKD